MSNEKLVENIKEQIEILAHNQLTPENNKYVKKLHSCVLKADLLEEDSLKCLLGVSDLMLTQLEKVRQEKPFTGCTILSQITKKISDNE